MAFFLSSEVVAACRKCGKARAPECFDRRAIAVLPPMASQYDSAREDIQEVLAGALNRQRQY